MKGLEIIPTTEHLIAAYDHLYSQDRDEEKIVLYAHWSRFDVRLAEILVWYLLKNWKSLSPTLLCEINKTSVWPQTLLVLLEHVALYLRLENNKDHKVFRLFKKIMTSNIQPTSYQSYSIGVLKVGGLLQKSRAESPNPLFARWGYYENGLFFNKNLFDRFKPVTFLNKKERLDILKKLKRIKKPIRVKDYMHACYNLIHRRQAERDLKRTRSSSKM